MNEIKVKTYKGFYFNIRSFIEMFVVWIISGIFSFIPIFLQPILQESSLETEHTINSIKDYTQIVINSPDILYVILSLCVITITNIILSKKENINKVLIYIFIISQIFVILFSDICYILYKIGNKIITPIIGNINSVVLIYGIISAVTIFIYINIEGVSKNVVSNN